MSCAKQWRDIGCPSQVLKWIESGVDIYEMFTHFKGNGKGQSYDGDSTPSIYFSNSLSCSGFSDFISTTLLERIANGSISMVGRVGECDPPFLVLPIPIEPSMRDFSICGLRITPSLWIL